MSTFEYDIYNRNTRASMISQIVALGDDDPIITMNGHMDITTTLTKSQVDGIVANSLAGTLEDAKVTKSNGIKYVTGLLISQGVEHLNGTLDLTYEMRGRLRDLIVDVNDGFIVLPQDVLTSYDVVTFTSISTIQNGIKAILDRGVYIVSSLSNSDASKGQSGYLAEINACTTIPQVNAITDTRV